MYSRGSFRALAAVWALLLAGGCDLDKNSTTKINGSVRAAAGTAAQALATVNGNVRVDDEAAATSASTVNGSVRLGARSSVESANTVNGSIAIGAGARIKGSIDTVNGSIETQDGVDIGGAVTNVNGNLELRSTHVAGRVKTVNGDIGVLGASRIDGGIAVEKPGGDLASAGSHVPKIVIGPGATVHGELRFERKVELFVSDKASIGTVTGAVAVPFSGDNPPQ